MTRLSIAIPTLNRAEYLSFTVEHFIAQMEPYADEVELIICNNASDDDTSQVISTIVKDKKFVQLHDCNERYDLGDNFKRAVSFTHGGYVILWGDDDIPAPWLVAYLLHLINTNSTELYYFNRLMGYEEGKPIKSLSVCKPYYEGLTKRYDNESDFIKENFQQATFMTSLMFSRDVWNHGMEFDTSKHYGYEFMGMLYYGNKGKHIDYIEYPLCIQRKVAKRAWSPNWPLYGLAGLPQLSIDLENEGILHDGYNVWLKKFNGLLSFTYILVNAAKYRSRYKSYCKKFASYQKGVFRKALVYVIIYACPSFMYDLSRKILFRVK